MAIATGTAALIAAGIAAGGTVAATKIQANAANKAARLQKQATDAALADEKEQRQYVRSQYEKEDQREQEARAGYQQYLASMGRGPAPTTSGTPTNMSPVAVAARNAVMQPGYSAHPAQSVQPTTLQDLAVSPVAPALMGPTPDHAGSMADISTGQGRTLEDLSRWNDWQTRGLGV